MIVTFYLRCPTPCGTLHTIKLNDFVSDNLFEYLRLCRGCRLRQANDRFTQFLFEDFE